MHSDAKVSSRYLSIVTCILTQAIGCDHCSHAMYMYLQTESAQLFEAVDLYSTAIVQLYNPNIFATTRNKQ